MIGPKKPEFFHRSVRIGIDRLILLVDQIHFIGFQLIAVAIAGRIGSIFPRKPVFVQRVDRIARIRKIAVGGFHREHGVHIADHGLVVGEIRPFDQIRKGGNQHRRQDGDDRDDDHQLYNGKASFSLFHCPFSFLLFGQNSGDPHKTAFFAKQKNTSGCICPIHDDYNTLYAKNQPFLSLFSPRQLLFCSAFPYGFSDEFPPFRQNQTAFGKIPPAFLS